MKHKKSAVNEVYFIPITDTTLELSVFWPSDTESWINKLRFSESISLGYGPLPAFAAMLRNVNCKHGTRDGKHADLTSRNVTLRQTFPQFFRIKDQNRL